MRTTWFWFVSVLLAGLSAGQTAPSKEATPPASSPPAVTFSRQWAAGEPQYLQVRVQADCAATYTSRKQADAEAFTEIFVLPQPDCGMVMELAKKAHFFNGAFDYTKHAIAQTGKKTLAYRDATCHYSTTYNWSDNVSIEELTSIFEGISGTLESGARLTSDAQFQPLALDSDLKALQTEVAENEARDLAMIGPILSKISENERFMSIARERARKLLMLAQGGK